MSPEPPVLTWVVHRALGAEEDFPIVEHWSRELAALKASRLTALTAHLVRPRFNSLPHPVRTHLEAALLLAETVADQGKGQLAESREVLDRAGIRWVTMKGWALATRLYSTAACRPSGDLDLLVAAEDVNATLGLFLELGYRPEGEDRSYHTRLVRDSARGASVIELHHRPGPARFGGLSTPAILAARQRFESGAGSIWIPSPEHEADLLIRHYLRHAGDQAILLLDILKLLAGRRLAHPLGALVGDDLSRLGLERTVEGPRRWSHSVLRRWMERRNYEERRAARHAALVGIPLALARSPLAAAGSLARVVWPARPTPRWIEPSRSGGGRFTWRLRRIARLGR
jgi:hypothetical protein